MGDSTELQRRRAQKRASYHRRKPTTQVLSDHLCECGCGQFTHLASRTSAEKGWIKGEPKRFVRGHHRRKYHGPADEARCRLCDTTKPAQEFYADKQRPNGLSSACRECLKSQAKARYAANPELYKARSKQWVKDNPERHRVLANERRQRRRTRIREGIVEKVDPHAIYERDGGKCHICGKRVAKKDMSLDHLTPIAKGGNHVALNVRLAHVYCNVKRGVDRIPAQLLMH